MDDPARQIPPARPAPTTRLDPAGTESPQAATVHLDAEPAPPRLDAVAVNSAAGSIVQHALEIVLPILAFLAVLVFTVPVWEMVEDELRPGALATTAGFLVRAWLAYLAARYVSRNVTPCAGR